MNNNLKRSCNRVADGLQRKRVQTMELATRKFIQRRNDQVVHPEAVTGASRKEEERHTKTYWVHPCIWFSSTAQSKWVNVSASIHTKAWIPTGENQVSALLIQPEVSWLFEVNYSTLSTKRCWWPPSFFFPFFLNQHVIQLLVSVKIQIFNFMILTSNIKYDYLNRLIQKCEIIHYSFRRSFHRSFRGCIRRSFHRSFRRSFLHSFK